MIYWKSEALPTVGEWIKSIGNMLRMDSFIYHHRGWTLKYEKLWAPWLDVPGLAPVQLIVDRLLRINARRSFILNIFMCYTFFLRQFLPNVRWLGLTFKKRDTHCCCLTVSGKYFIVEYIYTLRTILYCNVWQCKGE